MGELWDLVAGAKGQSGLPVISRHAADQLANELLNEGHEISIESGPVLNGNKILKVDNKPAAYVVPVSYHPVNHPYQAPAVGFVGCLGCGHPANSAVHMPPAVGGPVYPPKKGAYNHVYAPPTSGAAVLKDCCEKCWMPEASPNHYTLDPAFHQYMDQGNRCCAYCGHAKLSTIHTGKPHVQAVASDDYKAAVEAAMVKYAPSIGYLKGTHDSHLSDPVGTVDTQCVDCQSLWDARVKKLGVMFAVQLHEDCPELGAGLEAKVVSAWFKVTKQE